MVSVSARFISVAVGCQNHREVDAKCGFGADEGRVEMDEGVGKDCDRIGVAEAGKGMSAPAGEVHWIERDVGSIVGPAAGWEQVGSAIEGMQAGGLVAVGSEGFAVCGG